MGITAHHAIVVTANYDKWAEKAHAIASDLFWQVSELSEPTINGNQSFCVFPDGSNEGWPDSNDGDDRRDTFVEWLRAQCYEDGSSPLKWVEVHFGELDGANGAEVTRHAWQRREAK